MKPLKHLQQHALPRPVVLTDLDGTLLDHSSYSYEAARPALHLLGELDIPLILVSSKTQAELAQLQTELALQHPCISENGASLNIPQGYFPSVSSTAINVGKDRSYWCDILHNIDADLKSCFHTFSQLGTAGIVEVTGLSIEKARKANQRSASEPIQWLGNEQQLQALEQTIEKHGGHIVKGGRFYHVLDATVSKGKALKKLLSLYQQNNPDGCFKTIVLGDAPNDLSMLELADYPIIIRSAHHAPPQSTALKKPIISKKIGPEGWNECLSALINKEFHN